MEAESAGTPLWGTAPWGAPMTLGWVQQHHLGRVGSPRVRGRGCCDSSLDMGLGNMGHVGEAVGQLLVVDGIHSGWLGKLL